MDTIRIEGMVVHGTGTGSRLSKQAEGGAHVEGRDRVRVGWYCSASRVTTVPPNRLHGERNHW